MRPIGGAQRVAIQQAKSFGLEEIYYLRLKRDELDGIQFVPFMSFSSLLKFIKSDQLYTHSTLAGWLGRLFVLIPFKSRRVYHTFHGFNALKMPLGKIYLFIEQLFSFLDFRAIFVCEADYSLAKKLSIVRGQRSRVIYNSSEDFGVFKNRSSQKGEIKILSLARCASQKDFETLARALSLSVNAHLVVDNYGGGDVEGYREKYGSPKLNFLGEVESVKDLLNKYNYGILISNYEGMPISLLEMLSAGLRLIATDVGGVAEIITPDVEGCLVEKHNPEQLAMIFNSITYENNVKSKTNEQIWRRLFSPQNYENQLLRYARD